jgi:hypothetical protein
MSTSPDERAQLMPVMQACEVKVMKEIEAEQIVHVPLDEYAVGSPRYEKLWQSIQLAHRFSWDTGEANV